MQGLNVEDPAIRNAVRMANVAQEAREQFCAAFLAQTGLMPEDATMNYGTKLVGTDKVFQVWFERNEVRDELAALRALAVSVAKGEAEPAKARQILLLYGGNQAVAGITAQQPEKKDPCEGCNSTPVNCKGLSDCDRINEEPHH